MIASGGVEQQFWDVFDEKNSQYVDDTQVYFVFLSNPNSAFSLLSQFMVSLIK